MVISGWGMANQLNGLLSGLDKGLPADIVFTCLNPGQGLSPQPAAFGQIAQHRPVWVMPWLEGDAKLWHPQPRVTLLREHLQLGQRQGAQGVVAIHWRTEDIRANFEAFAQFSKNPQAADVEAFYQEDSRRQFGPAAAAELAPLLVRMDREQWFESMRSMEYYPYDPSWGRLQPDQKARLLEAAQQVKALVQAAAREP